MLPLLQYMITCTYSKSIVLQIKSVNQLCRNKFIVYQ